MAPGTALRNCMVTALHAEALPSLWHQDFRFMGPLASNMKVVRIVGFGAQPQLRNGDCLSNPEDGAHRSIKIELLEVDLT